MGALASVNKNRQGWPAALTGHLLPATCLYSLRGCPPAGGWWGRCGAARPLEVDLLGNLKVDAQRLAPDRVGRARKRG